jgi:hypothetical protein
MKNNNICLEYGKHHNQIKFTLMKKLQQNLVELMFQLFYKFLSLIQQEKPRLFKIH